MRLLYMISLFLIMASRSNGGKVSTDVEVFWIPPEVETYVPVTPENIEKMAFKIVWVKNEKQAEEVVGLIQTSNQAVDSKRIRVKISTGDKYYTFDSDGIGVSSAGEAVRIDLKRLKLVQCE